jgi:hypothetical protein
MLVEQAFMALPEFLVGAPYERYEHEGTLVMAFSMSLLQELNGRNVNNPISLVRGEAMYQEGSNKRADLHLKFDPLSIETDDLRTYGYREAAWIEAKFFRRHTSGPKAGRAKKQGTDAVQEVHADIIRLACLPPETVGANSTQGRYLLHAYQGTVTEFLPFGKSKTRADSATGTPVRPAFDRDWTQKIVVPGQAVLKDFRARDEGKTFDTKVGAALRGIELKVTVTNFAHVPSPVTDSTYTLVLTRLDEVDVALVTGGGMGPLSTFSVRAGSVSENHVGAHDMIRRAVLANVK